MVWQIFYIFAIVLIDEESNICAADFGGVRQNARLDLLPDAKIGDYVLIHAGYAIEKLSEQAAKESLESWDELLEVLEEEDREREARYAEMENGK